MGKMKYLLTIMVICAVGILIYLQPAVAEESIDIQLQPVPISGDISINSIGEGVLSNCNSHQVHMGLNYLGTNLVKYSLETASENYQIIPSYLHFSIFTTALSNIKSKNSQITFKIKNDKYPIEDRVRLLIGAKIVAVDRYENGNRSRYIWRYCNLKPYETYLVSISYGSFSKLSIYKFNSATDAFDPIVTIDLGADSTKFLDELSSVNVYAGSQETEAKFWDQSLRIMR